MSGSNNAQGRATPQSITGSTNETRTLAHTGADVGDSNVSRLTNTTGSLTPILKWTVPKKYRQLVYAGGKHVTKAELRTREDFPSHSGTTLSISALLQPIAGEPQLDEQPYPTVVVANTTTGNELTVDSIDYAANEITLATDPSGDDVAVWTAISEGTIKYVAENQFDQQVGPLDKFGVPLHVFNDFKQDRNQTQIHLIGSAQFRREEKLVAVVDSPQEVKWEDSDYPRGQYASRYEQEVDVSV